MFDFSIFIFYILQLLEAFQQLLGNYGWAIIAVTLLIKLFLLPLSIKQTLASKKMQDSMGKLKPELDRIKSRFELRKKKHENNPEKLAEVQKEFQQQLMETYQKGGGFNPLGGCLPTLLQLPILIAMYWSFSGSPFQASYLELPIQAVEVQQGLSDKLTKSKVVNFVVPGETVTRLRIESDIPDGKLSVAKKYHLSLTPAKGTESELSELLSYKEVSWFVTPHPVARGKKPKHIETGEDYDSIWRKRSIDKQGNTLYQLLSPKDQAKVLENPDNHKYLEVSTEPGETDNAPLRTDLVTITPDPDNPLAATLEAKASTEKFFVTAAIDDPEHEAKSFLFVQDLGHIGLFDKAQKKVHWDIVILILLMVGSFFATTKLMTKNTAQMPSLDPNQEKMQKQMQSMLPLLFVGVFIFAPIPAAVFVYLFVSNIFQVLQTFLGNYIAKRSADKPIIVPPDPESEKSAGEQRSIGGDDSGSDQ